MTRTYWAGVMFFSLTFSIAAGVLTFRRLQEKSAVEVPLKTIPVPMALPAPPKPAAPENPAPPEKPAVKPAHAEQKPGKTEKRNILFTYKKSSAKEVSLTGSFNDWTREKMIRNADKKRWEISLKITPGHYEYKFVVDGRKIRDPNNRLYTPEGNSILKVKPADSK